MKKTISLVLAAVMVLSLGLAAPAGATDSAEVTKLSMEGIDLHALMSRPVTQHGKPTPMDGKTPTGMLCENSNGLSRSNVGPNTSVIKGQPLFPEETGNGAYYYATSDFSTAYSEAFVNVKLPTSLNTLNGKRAAFISLGVQGYQGNGGVDIGLRNDGSGWYPAYGDVYGGYYGVFDQDGIDTAATNVKICVRPLNTTTIRVYMQGYTANDTPKGNEFYRDITVASGNFDTVGGVVRCRYYRFASLVPNGNGTSGVSDGSYMRGAQMWYCQLYNSSNQYVTWAIPSSNVTNCWVVYPSKLSLSYSQYADTFNINYT